MSKRVVDAEYIGKIYNKLTIKTIVHEGNPSAICICECGKQVTKVLYDIRIGKATSCGCSKKKSRLTHGQSKSPLYIVWGGMSQRINNPKHRSFEQYGGRGISICEEWKTYEPFYKWAMSNGYKKGLVLDRIDNDSHYSPLNCRWTTQKVNANNTRRNRHIVIFGNMLTFSGWCQRYNVDPRSALYIFERDKAVGKDFLDALFYLVQLNKKKRNSL